MYRLEKEATLSTPYILIDEAAAYMKWQGESFPENVIKTYQEIIDWMEGYISGEFKEFVFDCELIYFNSSTSKVLHKLFTMMDSVGEKKKMIVNWICSRENDIMLERGEEFKECFSGLDFRLQFED